MVTGSVAEGAFIAHRANITSVADRQALDNSRSMLMLNGLGLMLVSLRAKKSSSLIVPLTLLTAGTGLFSGIIFWELQFRVALPSQCLWPQAPSNS